MHVLRNALDEFLKEDIGRGDITSAILPNVKAKAEIICKERAVIAGIKEACILFELVRCKAKNLVRESSFVKPNTPIITVTGNAKAILSAERTALNVLMRMSGVSTETRRFVDEVQKINHNVRIACTRKTSPGFRIFDKRAVKVGGGDMHRMRLDEMVLIKDNHLAITGSIKKAIKTAREIHRTRSKIEVEVGSLDEAIEAIEAGADIIMLDNLTPKHVRSVVDALKKKGLRKKVMIEVSGGVTHKNVKQYASADIDLISIGSLTHSVKAVDMSLAITKS
ncbi:MAG: carboxylating nicotinate-nucleotide diphosphorylase [Thaumarchaeota archaeon]|nr:carboxylating nicotinate-nucleotide diphosphorylase [Nitrososphaerota archaeon]